MCIYHTIYNFIKYLHSLSLSSVLLYIIYLSINLFIYLSSISHLIYYLIFYTAPMDDSSLFFLVFFVVRLRIQKFNFNQTLLYLFRNNSGCLCFTGKSRRDTS